MKNLLVLSFVCLLASCSSSEENAAQQVIDGQIKLPENFNALVVHEGLGITGRHMAVRDNGDIFVKGYRFKQDSCIVALRDTNGDAMADEVAYFENYEGTGMAIYDNSLYVSSNDEIFRYQFNGDELVPNLEKELIASGFPEQNEHEAKGLTFDGAGNMYVSVGGPSNACMEQHRTPGSAGMDPCPQLEWQGGIWKFSATQPGQTQQEHASRYATGLRNAMALDWDFATNSLYSMSHGRDQLHMFFQDMYTPEQSAELPSEEFFMINEGDDFGWPYCYYDHLQGKKVLAPEYGGDGGNIQGRCEEKKDPIVGFPGHLAPNDLLFYTGDLFPDRYKNGAFIAFHGSWNRGQDQKGYLVAFVPFENGEVAGDWEIFAEGFAGAEVIPSPRNAEYRPCGLAQAPDGSLIISDSQKGKIWKITYSAS